MRVEIHRKAVALRRRYVRLKDNVNQLWWCWRKMDVRSEGRLIQFYELHQYTAHAMLRYEKIYGPGFATTVRRCWSCKKQ